MDLKLFGEQLRTLRQEAGWSQEALIEALDQLARSGPASEYRVIDGTLLSRWERAHTQKGRTWKPTRTYMLYLIQLFAPYLDLVRAQAWAAQAGHAISVAELQVWFPIPTAADGAATNAQPKSADSAENTPALPHNLPTVLTSFVGRDAEIARLLDYLADSTLRLITLVGEGGVGKTRLALQVAHRVINQGGDPFQDGVYFVSLIGVSAASFVVSALANALGLTLAGASDPEQQLLADLQQRRSLLVLDNFEHLLADATPLITAILQTAPGVHLLVTSRERLNLAEEWVLALDGLAFPRMTAASIRLGQDAPSPLLLNTTVEADYAAVQLFMDRARQAKAAFGEHPDPVKNVAIARICSLLQGIPLGIEMAAAWAHMLSCAEIGDEIAQNLDFLTSPHRHIPERHRSMRAVFEQSWRLLNAVEQGVLAALSVFQGGFTREAASSVAKASFLTLRSLVDKSLLKVSEGRYEVHELLRQFAEEKLQVAPVNEQAIHRQHAIYYGELLKRDEEFLNTEKRMALLSLIRAEVQNVRMGWDWAVTHREEVLIEQYMTRLWYYYTTMNWFQEMQSAIQLVINAFEIDEPRDQATSHLFAKALSRHALCSYRLGQFDSAKSYLQKSLLLLQNEEQEQGIIEGCFASQVLGMIHYIQGRYAAAHNCFERSYIGAQKTTDVVMKADISYKLGDVAFALGNNDEAYHWYQSSLALYRQENAERGIGIVLRNLGELAEARGQVTEAYQHYQQSLWYLERVGDREQIARSSLQMGILAQASHYYELAEQWYQKGQALAQEIRVPLLLARTFHCLGDLASDRGETEKSQAYLGSAFEIAVKNKTEPLALQIILSMATLLLNDPTRFHQSQLLPDGQAVITDTDIRTYQLLKLVANHSSALFVTRNRAKTKLNELATKLSGDVYKMLESQTLSAEFEQTPLVWQKLLTT